MTAALALPCQGRTGVYDALLDGPEQQPAAYQAAHATAVRLCAACPAPCPDKVTADTGPRPLTLLAPDWMPPIREGRPEPVDPPRRTWSAERRAGAALTPGRGYVRPHQRAAAWARMAAQLAADGRTVPEIALALCVDEPTALALIGGAQQTAA